LFDAGEVVLHALDGDVLPCFDALGLQHLAESAFSFLGNESVLCLELTVHRLITVTELITLTFTRG
jgi:hypothetical protein